MALRTKLGLKQQIILLILDNMAKEISAADVRSILNDMVDSFALVMGGTPVVLADDMYFGTSADAIPEAAEATVAAVAGVGEIDAYAGSMYLLIFRLASESDISSVVFSDDPSRDNAAGAFTKYGATLIPPGETEAFSVWISNQALTQAVDVTITVS